MDQSPAAAIQRLGCDSTVKRRELYLAVTADDRETAVRLLDEGVSVHTTNNERVSLMHEAAWGGHVTTMRLLIERGANVDAIDGRGLTPLHSAAAQGETETVRELIKYKASKSLVASTFGTPLHQAASKGHVETTKAMLEEGCSVDIKNSAGSTVLHWAAEGGHVEIVKALVDRGCDVNAVKRNGCTPLHSAAACGESEVVRELMKHGAKSLVARLFGTPLQQAYLNGHVATVEAMSEDGMRDVELTKPKVALLKKLPKECNAIDTSATFNVTPQMHALLFGNLEMFKLLLSKGGSISDKDILSLSTFEHCFVGGHTNKLSQFCNACGIGSGKEGLRSALAALIHQDLVDANKVLCLCAISGDSLLLEDEFVDLVSLCTCPMPDALKCAMFYFFNGADILNQLRLPDKCPLTPLHMALLSLKCYRMGYATLCVEHGVKDHATFIDRLLSHALFKDVIHEKFGNGLSPLDVAQQFELHDIAASIERAGGRPGVWANIPPQIEARHSPALLQIQEAYPFFKAIAEDNEGGMEFIKYVVSSFLLSKTVEKGVQTYCSLTEAQDGMWHPNAAIVGADVGPETDNHEYKSLLVTVDKSKKPPLMRPCKDIKEVLNKVTSISKEINAMLNHHSGGIVHFGIQDEDNTVEEGLDLNQAVAIDKLQTRVSQLLQEFYPAVQTQFVTIQPVKLLNSSREPTGRWRFDICVAPYDRVAFLARNQTVAYYRQGANSERMPADMLTERLLGPGDS